MTTIFKELPITARFQASNYQKIIDDRGDWKTKWSSHNEVYPTFIKRDEFGGHIITKEFGTTASVYYRIEPDNVVETI